MIKCPRKQRKEENNPLGSWVLDVSACGHSPPLFLGYGRTGSTEKQSCPLHRGQEAERLREPAVSRERPLLSHCLACYGMAPPSFRKVLSLSQMFPLNGNALRPPGGTPLYSARHSSIQPRRNYYITDAQKRGKDQAHSRGPSGGRGSSGKPHSLCLLSFRAICVGQADGP